MKVSDHSESARTTHRPSVCPARTSASVTTTAKRPDVDSDWRSERCGEVWNIGRGRDGLTVGITQW